MIFFIFFSSGFLQEAVFNLRRARRSQQSIPLAGLLQPVLLRQSVAGVLHRVGLLLQSQRAERRTPEHQDQVTLSHCLLVTSVMI